MSTDAVIARRCLGSAGRLSDAKAQVLRPARPSIRRFSRLPSGGSVGARWGIGPSEIARLPESSGKAEFPALLPIAAERATATAQPRPHIRRPPGPPPREADYPGF